MGGKREQRSFGRGSWLTVLSLENWELTEARGKSTEPGLKLLG